MGTSRIPPPPGSERNKMITDIFVLVFVVLIFVYIFGGYDRGKTFTQKTIWEFLKDAFSMPDEW